MRTTLALLPLLLFVLISSGCVYAHIKTPYDTNLDETVLGDKEGESSFQSILWLFAWGDAGTAAAAKEGNITQINHMDQKVLSVLFGLYYHQTTIVYGD